ncbi:MAG: hypothetical protein H0U18_03355 [Pyrinomonadaceae bacterium]|nr:hypothetical protein [Pyrinomonadaceae bacterium]
MGEYATFKGLSVKIGTCENMYYLRADQANHAGDFWSQVAQRMAEGYTQPEKWFHALPDSVPAVEA